MKNKVAVLIKSISKFIYIFGFIGGFLISIITWGSLPSTTDSFFSFFVFMITLLTSWITIFIVGSLFLALSEIITLLNTISQNTTSPDTNLNNSK